MRSIFLILVVSCWAAFGHAQETKNSRRDTADTNTRIEKLKQAFKQKDYNTFFKYFPDTFNELLETYKDKPITTIDYHFRYLREYKGHVSPEVFVEKVYGIAKNGVWDTSDNVSRFQSHLEDSSLGNPKILLKILATKPDTEAANFWHFLLDDGMRRTWMSRQFEVIYNKITPIDKRQGKLLKEEFERMYKESPFNCGD